MTVQITVGDINPLEGSQETRGTVTARLARRRGDDQRVMVEMTTVCGPLKCTVQLTIGEAELLLSGLDSIIFDAATQIPASPMSPMSPEGQ